VRREWVIAVAGVLVGTAVGVAPAAPAYAASNCKTGPGQLTVERYIAENPAFGKVVVDGRQSATECTAVKRFQARFGISPAAGYAGATTKSVAGRLLSAKVSRCRTGTRVCVDLSSQTFWMVRSGKVVLGPTTLRSGRAGGYRTPTGTFRIGTKKKITRSSYYGTKMPYWQQFHRDMGFHETPSYLYQGPGSHGCLNLLRRDAVKLYDLTKRGTPVQIFGRKPGT
jgi:lipoprotein-anchoring transpeptidase ErfK/SrfK